MSNLILYFLVLLSPFSLLADLIHLEQRARKELEYLDFPPRMNWIPARKTTTGNHIYDVVIIGGGQTGMTIAFGLMSEKVTNIAIFDENNALSEGSWVQHARMNALRTPKYTTGPDCDIPILTVRAWFEAKYGQEKWDAITYIPRLDWIAYLQWLREFLDLPLENNTKVGSIKWCEEENSFLVPCKGPDDTNRVVYARKIVIATRLQGSGEWHVPEFIKNNIPHGVYYHTSDDINFTKFSGKTVGVLGGGPCAFDNAYIASFYADEVHMFFKKPKLVNLHIFLWGEFVGFQHFIALPDENKWKFVSKMYEIGQPPTPYSVEAIKSRSNIHMHFESPWEDAEMVGKMAVITTPKRKYTLDNLIIAIGWRINLELRDKFKELKDQIALWSDKYNPTEKAYPDLLRAPYLTNGFCFSEKIPGTAPYLKSIFNSTGGALVSAGFSAGTGISGMRYSVKHLVHELVDQLFVEDQETHYKTLENYDQCLFES